MGELVTTVLDGGSYPLSTFFNRHVGKANNVVFAPPTKGEIHLDIDDLGLDPQHRGALHFQQHSIPAPFFSITIGVEKLRNARGSPSARKAQTQCKRLLTVVNGGYGRR